VCNSGGGGKRSEITRQREGKPLTTFTHLKKGGGWGRKPVGCYIFRSVRGGEGFFLYTYHPPKRVEEGWEGGKDRGKKKKKKKKKTKRKGKGLFTFFRFLQAEKKGIFWEGGKKNHFLSSPSHGQGGGGGLGNEGGTGGVATLPIKEGGNGRQHSITNFIPRKAQGKR